MTYSAYGRRRRRRTIVAVVVVIAAVLALVVAVGRATSSRQLAREYLDTAVELLEIEIDASDRLATLISDLEQYERPRLVELLDEIDEEARQVVRDLESANPPTEGDLGTAHGFLTVAVLSWRDGVVAIRDALLALSEDPLTADAVEVLEGAMADLAVGDTAYQGFVAAAERSGDTEVLADPLPGVRFIPLDADAYDGDAIARRMLITPGLGVVENLAIADLKLDPAPVGEREGIPLVPLSESLNVEATVANRGTVSVGTVLVALNLVSNDGELFESQQGIESLEPGELSTLVFTGLPVQPGGLYEVSVALANPDDDASDDLVSFVFIRNADE
jgi:hypothetical protein